MKMTETQLRGIVRQEILREYGFIEASYMGSGRYWEAITGIIQDMFGPTTADRLARTGDDKVIDKYHTFMGTLHMLPEYKTVWENYKTAQRMHASMDKEFDRARDIRHPVGRAFSNLKTRVLGKFDELERTLSPENRDIWQPSVDEMRQIFVKMFDNWEMGKITTGRVLSTLDPRGVVESRRPGRRISEAGEMFAGKDLEQLQTTEFLAALEMADMDLEDAGCPAESDARVMAFEAMEMIDSGRERPGYSVAMLTPIAKDVISAIRSCRQIDRSSADRIANDLESALSRAQEHDRY